MVRVPRRHTTTHTYKVAFPVKTESIIYCYNFKEAVENGLNKLSFSKYETWGNSRKRIIKQFKVYFLGASQK